MTYILDKACFFFQDEHCPPTVNTQPVAGCRVHTLRRTEYEAAVTVIIKILESHPMLFPIYKRRNVKIVKSCCECCLRNNAVPEKDEIIGHQKNDEIVLKVQPSTIASLTRRELSKLNATTCIV